MASPLPVFAVAAAAFAVLAGPALADPIDVEVANTTGRDLAALELAPAGSGAFGENVLGGAFLPAGNAVTLTLADSADGCAFDIRYSFTSGDAIEETDVDLCATGSLQVSE